MAHPVTSGVLWRARARPSAFALLLTVVLLVANAVAQQSSSPRVTGRL